MPNLIARVLGKIVTETRAYAEAVYDGLIPPFIGYQGLQEFMDSSYAVGMYTTDSHNKSGFYAWEREAIGEYVAQGKCAMVLAAGGGREVIALSREGVHVDAWECNPTLQQIGNRLLREESIPVTIRSMQADSFPDLSQEDEIYDFCIIGWSAYCHILRKQDRIALLEQVGKHCKGPVLISFGRKDQPRKLKILLRDLVSSLPGTTKGMSYDLVATPSVSWVGFDEAMVRQEAKEAGYRTAAFKDHPPDYPYAVLMLEDR